MRTTENYSSKGNRIVPPMIREQRSTTLDNAKERIRMHIEPRCAKLRDDTRSLGRQDVYCGLTRKRVGPQYRVARRAGSSGVLLCEALCRCRGHCDVWGRRQIEPPWYVKVPTLERIVPSTSRTSFLLRRACERLGWCRSFAVSTVAVVGGVRRPEDRLGIAAIADVLSKLECTSSRNQKT